MVKNKTGIGFPLKYILVILILVIVILEIHKRGHRPYGQYDKIKHLKLDNIKEKLYILTL